MNRSLSAQITAFYRGWHAWESQHSAERAKFVVIDDLAAARIAPQRFRNRTDVVATCRRVLNAAEHSSTLESYQDYTVAKLSHSLAFLTDAPGRRLAAGDMARRGTPWVPVTDAELADLHATYDQLRRAAIAEAAVDGDRYFDEPLEPDGVGTSIAGYAQTWLPRLYQRYSWLQRFAFSHQSVSSAAGWRNMVTHDPPGFVLLVNTARHHTYTRALAETFALHEICGHMVHLAQLAANSRLQTDAPHLLCIAIHTQDSYLTEGIAQLLAAHLVATSDGHWSAVAAAFQHFVLHFAVRHRHIMDLVEDAISLDAAATRHRDFLGGEVAAHRAGYERLLQDPFFCCQVLNYHGAFMALRPLLALSPTSFDVALRNLLTGFYSPSALGQMVAEYLRGHHAA